MTTEPYLLTPGPLTTSLRTRQSMLRDWGSWDVDFNSITGRVRERLLHIVHGSGTHECVPMQGSGTFSVEAAIGTLVPRTGHPGCRGRHRARPAHRCFDHARGARTLRDQHRDP